MKTMNINKLHTVQSNIVPRRNKSDINHNIKTTTEFISWYVRIGELTQIHSEHIILSLALVYSTAYSTVTLSTREESLYL